MNLPWSPTAAGIRLAVRVTPRSARNAVAGIVDTPDGRAVLAIRLTAPPVESAANQALRRYLSDLLGVPAGKVMLVSGQTARLKIVEVAGDTLALTARLKSLTG